MKSPRHPAPGTFARRRVRSLSGLSNQNCRPAKFRPQQKCPSRSLRRAEMRRYLDFVWHPLLVRGVPFALAPRRTPTERDNPPELKGPRCQPENSLRSTGCQRKNAPARRNDTQGPSPRLPERGYGACHSSSAGWWTSGDFHPKGRAWVARFGSAREYPALSRDPSAPGAVNVTGEIHGFRCSGHPNISFHAA